MRLVSLLAQADPDGEPLAALTWRRNATVLTIWPPAGTAVTKWSSVVVTWAVDDGGVREPRRQPPDSPFSALTPAIGSQPGCQDGVNQGELADQ